MSENEITNKYDGSDGRPQNMSRTRCQDELAIIQESQMKKLQRMCHDWEAIAELNRRKEKIETRLAELGF